MIATAPTCPHRATHLALIRPDNTRLAHITGSVSIPSSSWNPSRIMIPMLQGLLTWDPVTCSSRDRCATMCHGDHLVSRPPHWWTWALRVPTLVSCYSCLIYIIDAPFRLQDRWICVFPHSWIGGWLYVPLCLIPWLCPPYPSCGQLP